MILDNAQDLDKEIDDLFKDPEDTQPQEDPSITKEDNKDNQPKSEMTLNMINRINEVKAKTEKEVLDRVAKESGYESYEAMKKAKEEKLVKDHGFDIKDVETVIKPLLEQRLADDPRFKKLEQYEQRERDLYIKEQLAAINKTTGQNLKPTDLPKETIDLWSKGIDLEQAYYATQGKTLLTKGISQSQNGTLNHLAPGSSAGTTKSRAYTDEEKQMYAAIMGMGGYQVTDKDMALKTIAIKTEK